MAIFKVGQRVKVLDAPDHLCRAIVGKTATITHGLHEFFGLRYTILLDEPVAGDREWYAMPDCLAPLTDPKADEFIERIKQWGPLHEEPLHTLSSDELAKVMGGSR